MQAFKRIGIEVSNGKPSPNRMFSSFLDLKWRHSIVTIHNILVMRDFMATPALT